MSGINTMIVTGRGATATSLMIFLSAVDTDGAASCAGNVKHQSATVTYDGTRREVN